MPALALYDPPLALSNSTVKHEVNIFRIQDDDIIRERLLPGAASSTPLDIPVANVATKGLKALLRNHIQVFVGKDLKFILWQDEENQLQCSKPPLHVLGRDLVGMVKPVGSDYIAGIAQCAFLRSTPFSRHASKVLLAPHESACDDYWADSSWAYRAGMPDSCAGSIKEVVTACWREVVDGAQQLGIGRLSVGKWSERDGQKIWIFEDRLGYSYSVKSRGGPSVAKSFFVEADFTPAHGKKKKTRPKSAPASRDHLHSSQKSVMWMDLEKHQFEIATALPTSPVSKGPSATPKKSTKKTYHSVTEYEERLHKVAGVWIVIQNAILNKDSVGETSLLQDAGSGWQCSCTLGRGKTSEVAVISVLPTRFDIDAERHGFRHGDSITFSIRYDGNVDPDDDDVRFKGTFDYDFFFPRGFNGPFQVHGKDGRTVELSLSFEMKWASQDLGLTIENLARSKRDKIREIEERRRLQDKFEKEMRKQQRLDRWKFAESPAVGIQEHRSRAFENGSPDETKEEIRKRYEELRPKPKKCVRKWSKQYLDNLAKPKQRELPPSREHSDTNLEYARYQAACAARGGVVPWGEDYIPNLNELALPRKRILDTQESQGQFDSIDADRLEELAQPKYQPEHRHDYLRKSKIEEELLYEVELGLYQIINAAIVKEGFEPDSRQIIELHPQSFVRVLEVQDVGDRVRARIEKPPGWISLLNRNTEVRFAMKVDESRNRRKESILHARNFDYEENIDVEQDCIVEQDWIDSADFQSNATHAYTDPLLVRSQSWYNRSALDWHVPSRDISQDLVFESYCDRFGTSALRWAQSS